MKKYKRYSINLLLIIMIIFLFSCNKIDKNENNYGVFSSQDFVKVDNNKLRKNYGQGEEIYLHGINAGGYLIVEEWMCALDVIDHKSAIKIFIERFGKDKTIEIWEYYRNNFWTEQDFINCLDMGINVIRLPFSYMSIDPNYYNVNTINKDKFNFEVLDNFIFNASKYGIYIILDLHGAYGSQNGQDHSGEFIENKEDVDFYQNEINMNKTILLWKEIASRYKNNPVIVAYDILNEPGEKASLTTKKHWDFFDRIYDAIREVDNNHVICFESCWGAEDLPLVDEYNWENVMYSFHHYSGEYLDADKNFVSMQNIINEIQKKEFNVPIYIGEFTCYGIEESWRKVLNLLNLSNFHYSPWTYKINLRKDGYKYSGWGIYYTQAESVDPKNDTLEEIFNKWYQIDTSYENVMEMKFDSGMSLKNIIKNYYKQ